MPIPYPGANGVQYGGYQWDSGALPQPSVASFLVSRNIRLIRVPLNIRHIYPTDGGALASGVVTALKAFADECDSYDVDVIWDAHTSGAWPDENSATRVTIDQLRDFWVLLDDSTIGQSHAAVRGYSIMNRPTGARTANANADTDSVYGNVGWAANLTVGSTDTNNARLWVQEISAAVVAGLRASGCTKTIYVPLLYIPGLMDASAQIHTGGPWINDANVWYETGFYPLARISGNAEDVNKSFAAHDNDAKVAGLGTNTTETVYYTSGSGGDVLIPAPISSANPLALPSSEDTGGGPNPLRPSPVLSLSANPYNGAVGLQWGAPAEMHGALSLSYLIEDQNGLSYSTVEPELLADGLTNATEYTFTVYAATEFGISDGVAVVATPLDTLPFPQPDEEVPPPRVPTPVEQPTTWAFWPGSVFVPINWMKDAEHVVEPLRYDVGSA